MKQYDVFISYRRDGGSETARLLQTSLEARGYKVFLDVDSLRDGHFDKALLRYIENSTAVIVILSVNSLDRCTLESDWLHRELAHALQAKRRIIPVTMPGFSFPAKDDLPEALQELDRHESINYSHDHFTSVLTKLCRLIGRPRHFAAILSGKRIRAALIAGGSLLVAFCLFLFSFLSKDRALNESQQSVLKRMSTDLAMGLVNVDATLDGVEKTTQQALDYYDSVSRNGSDDAKKQALLLWIDQQEQFLANLKWIDSWDKSLLTTFPEERYHMHDNQLFFESLFPHWQSDLEQFYVFTRQRIEVGPAGWLQEERRVFELRRDACMQLGKSYYYSVFEVLLDYPDEVLEEANRVLQECRYLPVENRPNSSDAAHQASESAGKKVEKIMTDLAMLIGNENRRVQEVEKELKARMAASLVIGHELVEQAARINSRLGNLKLVWDGSEQQRLRQIWDGSDGGKNQSIARKKQETKLFTDSMVERLRKEMHISALDHQMPSTLMDSSRNETDLYANLQKCYQGLKAVDEQAETLIGEVQALTDCGDIESLERAFGNIQRAERTFQIRAKFAYLDILESMLFLTIDEKGLAGISGKLSALNELSPKGLVAEDQLLRLKEVMLKEWQDIQSEKQTAISDLDAQTVALKLKRDETYVALREKCTVLPDDDPGIMWGKIVRMMSAGMYDDVEKQLDRYVEYAAKTMPQSGVMANAAKAYLLKARTIGVDYGSMVFSIENDAQHSVLRPGDIIVELNGERVMDADSYIAIKTQSGGVVRDYRYWRLDPSGRLQEYTAEGRVEDPRVGLADMMEHLEND